MGSESARPPVRRRAGPSPVLILAVIVIVVVAGVGAVYALHVGPFAKPATSEAACATDLTLDGEGAAFVNGLVLAWGSAYQSATQNQVNYNPAGSGAGVTQLTSNLVDFAATDEPLNTSQTNDLPGAPLTLPVTGGALTVLYNLPGFTGESTPLQLSGPVLADIYLGKITTWNDPRIANNNTGVTLPSDPITVVYRTDSAGLTFVLTTLLTDDSPAWATAHGAVLSMPAPPTSTKLGASGNTKMLDDVSSTSYAIGYSDFYDTVTQQSSSSQLQYAAVLNPAGNYVLPSEESAATAIEHISQNETFPAATASWVGINMVNAPGVHDYPLSTLAYFFVFVGETSSVGYTPSEARDQVIRQWVSWDITSGQSLASQYDFVPLSSQLVALDQAGLSEMTYNGASLPACS